MRICTNNFDLVQLLFQPLMTIIQVHWSNHFSWTSHEWQIWMISIGVCHARREWNKSRIPVVVIRWMKKHILGIKRQLRRETFYIDMRSWRTWRHWFLWTLIDSLSTMIFLFLWIWGILQKEMFKINLT